MQYILVIGGGFAGLSAALNGADQVCQHGGEIAVTVVSNSEYITMRPRLYEVNPQNLREPLPRYSMPPEFPLSAPRRAPSIRWRGRWNSTPLMGNLKSFPMTGLS